MSNRSAAEMAKAFAAARLGFRRLFSISAFTPPPAAAPPPKADPSTNLFVSGLSKRTTSEGLREAFSKFGEVVHAKVVTDRVSGYSKGFGFVRYASIEEASEGIQGMDGKFLDGWVIFAEYARPRPPLPQDQSSQPQLNYGSTPQSNYSSPLSQSTSYYTSPQSSNYSPHGTQPPLSNSYYAPQTSQPQQSYGGSVPPSNYESLQSQSGYSSNYFNHSNGSVPPFNYSSEISQPSSNSSTAPSWNTPQFNYSSEISQPSSNSSTAPSWNTPQTSDPSSAYTSTQNNYLKSENLPSYASPANSETFEPSSSNSSDFRSDYEPGRAANY